MSIFVKGVSQENDSLETKFMYHRNLVEKVGKDFFVADVKESYILKTDKKVPKLGLMMVGWGGNNGSTLTAGVIANRLNIAWETKEGKQTPNYYGSVTQSCTVKIGSDEDHNDVYAPLSSISPLVNPNDIVLGGWDINSMRLGDAMKRAKVLDVNLQKRLHGHMQRYYPLPSIYYPDFIASNQESRANNIFTNGSKSLDLEHIRNDIREFKSRRNLDKVIIMWAANTERFTDVADGLNVTAQQVLDSINNNADEISPSNIFAVASILEGCSFINGAPQNTLVPGIIELARLHNVHIAGCDLKTGQTKIKSVLVDFLISAGIKPMSIVSYNHLGNGDGLNLSEKRQFRSKEITKSDVVDDMVKSNSILYPEGEKPDHVVVIKYVPFVGDSKRAMDEYTSKIFMNGINTIVMHNTCEDSLLAVPIMLDLVIMTEFFSRLSFCKEGGELQKFDTILGALAYWIKAPMVPRGNIVNALGRQHRSIVNIMLAFSGMAIDTDLRLERM
jgi:myo-inositol-1-phosphate synthase